MIHLSRIDWNEYVSTLKYANKIQYISGDWQAMMVILYI